MASEWVQWTPQGKYEGPIPDYIWVEVLMLDSDTDQSFAGDFNWGVEDEGGEIIAYRIPTLDNQNERLEVKVSV